MVRNCAPENLDIPGSMLFASPRNDGITGKAPHWR